MIVALNNKSNLDKTKYLEYLCELNKIECSSQLILCPTFLNIANTNNVNFSLGAQNVSSEKEGAFTGEISANQLSSYGVKYCIVGHSERRKNQRESLEEINIKIHRLLENDIIPILCIGETQTERVENKVFSVLAEEIESALENLTDQEKNKIIIAYEPIWSIGTGIIPTLSEINEVFSFIKKSLPNTRILYGGSANEKNIDTLKEEKLIDGYLLGGLSLKPLELKVFLDKLEN